MDEEHKMPDRLGYPAQDRFDKVHCIDMVGGNERIGALMVDHDDVDLDATEAFAAEVARRWNKHNELEADLPRVKSIEDEIARLREVIAGMRTEAKTLGFDNQEKAAEIERLEARTIDGLSHDVLTTYGAPNGDGLTLLGRIEALADARDRNAERRKKAEAGLHDVEQALREAIKALHVFHGEPGWESYVKGSPEMKRWRALLDPPTGEERTA